LRILVEDNPDPDLTFKEKTDPGPTLKKPATMFHSLSELDINCRFKAPVKATACPRSFDPFHIVTYYIK